MLTRVITGSLDWTNVGIGLLIGLGAALAAVGVLLAVLNRSERATRGDPAERPRRR